MYRYCQEAIDNGTEYLTRDGHQVIQVTTSIAASIATLRHGKPSQLTSSQRTKEIREHYKERGKEYILPGEGI